ncbi:MAG TPA: PadR family transcriptional regulator [Candidatus Sulfotelmatobacter sp.]|nr:PadR family transcriptional regulator [Candidatus Sulfotelmatobacter sp.]
MRCGSAFQGFAWATAIPWAAYRPWNRWSRFFGSGEVRLALLSLLQDGPKHGYQLMKDLEARSGGLYRASAGATYPTLQQLEDEGLVESEQSEGRRKYRLTQAGKEELKNSAESVKRIWERAESWGDWAPWMGPAASMVAKPAAGVMKSAMRAATRAADNPERISKIREILEKARQDIEKLD